MDKKDKLFDDSDEDDLTYNPAQAALEAAGQAIETSTAPTLAQPPPPVPVPVSVPVPQPVPVEQPQQVPGQPPAPVPVPAPQPVGQAYPPPQPVPVQAPAPQPVPIGQSPAPVPVQPPAPVPVQPPAPVPVNPGQAPAPVPVQPLPGQPPAPVPVGPSDVNIPVPQPTPSAPVHYEEVKDLSAFSVSDPVKGGHTTYTVKGVDQDGEFELSRRYNDFYAVREHLQRHWPGVYIPPIPPKKSTGNKTEEFVEDRRVFLDRFMK